MKLKNYQINAADKLIKVTKKLLEKRVSGICVLKAPTGSGKTIILAEYLKQLSEEPKTTPFAFIWISGNKLHEQSRDKISKYLTPGPYSFSYLEEIQDNQFKENEIVFVNWHSLTKQDRKTGEYTNVFMRDNEKDKNLRTFIDTTKEKGFQIILFVDESHYHYWSDKSQQLVQDVIGPKLTLEVSATPKLEPSAEDISNGDAGFVSIKFDEVIKEGMIKTDVIINKEIGKNTDFHDVADEVILTAAIEKQKELMALYKKIGSSVHPLILVQLPNESEETSALDVSKLEFTENYLKRKHDITRQNGRLGIWLTDIKENIDDIECINNKTEVLIFKQAIALGWDCPRAQILVMFRDIKSATFEIQTVGRILRMPEAKHYDNDELNRAFVYTNLDRINIAKDQDSKSYFHINAAHRIPKYSNVSLPSIYHSRIDFGDLTLSFRRLFIEEANKYFGISEKDFGHIAKAKADKKLDLLPKELTEAVISDAVLHSIDNVSDVVGTIVHFSVPEDDIKYKYELFAKAMSLPYAPVRSHTKIQQAIYDWFDAFLGYKDSSRIEIQRIVVCSETNQKIFKDIIEKAKARFGEVKKKESLLKQIRKETMWDVPVIDYFNELYEKISAKRYVMDSCYLLGDRSNPEKDFEAYIEKCKNVLWWYKNGDSRIDYFGIRYEYPKGVAHTFYPDYIVKLTNGKIAIIETKDKGDQDGNSLTKAKAEALQVYITEQNKKVKKLFGGIAIQVNSIWLINQKKDYDWDKCLHNVWSDWQELDI